MRAGRWWIMVWGIALIPAGCFEPRVFENTMESADLVLSDSHPGDLTEIGEPGAPETRNPPEDAACVSDCQHRDCGPDGCGGTCGTCPVGVPCDETWGACMPDGWVLVEPGGFSMGTPGPGGDRPPEACRDEDEGPVHEVVFTHALLVSDHEVTDGEWEDVTRLSTPSYFSAQGPKPLCTEDSCPVSNVNWYEALQYCNLLSISEGLSPCYDLGDCTGTFGEGCGEEKVCYEGFVCQDAALSGLDCEGYRLLTEAEWERVARAGTTLAYAYPPPDGTENAPLECDCDLVDPLDDTAWYCGNENGQTRPVRGKAPNAWGLYDMAGNLYEWTTDHYQQYFYFDLVEVGSPAQDPLCLTGDRRVHRGGSWGAYSRWCRAGNRNDHDPDHRSRQIGFRVARTLTAPR